MVATSATETVTRRIAGERPGRMRALLVATTVGFGAAVMTYKLLRSGAGDEA